MDFENKIFGLATLFLVFSAVGLILTHASAVTSIIGSSVSGLNTLGQTIQSPGGGSSGSTMSFSPITGLPNLGG